MIVPMKKVSLIMLSNSKEQALKKLRKLGVLHIEITEGNGQRLIDLNGQITKLETAISLVSEKLDKKAAMQNADVKECILLSEKIIELTEEKEKQRTEAAILTNELNRLEAWGNIDPDELCFLAEKGLDVSLCEMSASMYDKADFPERTLVLSRTKSTVRFLSIRADDSEDATAPYRITLPEESIEDMQSKLDAANGRIGEIENELAGYASYTESMKKAVLALNKEVEFETYSTGMDNEELGSSKSIGIAYLTGYLPAEDLPKLQAVAKENAWGLTAEDPTEDDNAPTKLHNNKFVSLIYPLTDFLGTVPGYFEYDISAWFLGFILIFFGIIFGDGGYGLLIALVAGILILKSYRAKKPIPPAYLLILLMGGATILWGVLTCTWFGLPAEKLPVFLQKISIPVISNVYADKLWYPSWTNGEAALTTTQNLQIVCFTLALVQLSIAHIKGMVRNIKSLKMLGDLGAVLELIGIYYIVLMLVVNGAVFSLDSVIIGIPIGIVAIICIGVGFIINFTFANYEGSIAKSVLASLKGIVSVLLGVVNVFSDIVSYIRLWAVGLAGAAISATVNDLAGPMLGNFMFMILAIILLVFGHGLNMILNVLSVIVHGVRLNTLEFSTHLDMSWSGHNYKPFEE